MAMERHLIIWHFSRVGRMASHVLSSGHAGPPGVSSPPTSLPVTPAHKPVSEYSMLRRLQSAIYNHVFALQAGLYIKRNYSNIFPEVGTWNENELWKAVKRSHFKRGRRWDPSFTSESVKWRQLILVHLRCFEIKCVIFSSHRKG